MEKFCLAKTFAFKKRIEFVILFKQTKEYRNKEKQCRRADNHASQNTHAYGNIALCACTG